METPPNLDALIDGILSRTTDFTPEPNKKSLKDHVQWLEHRLAVAKIPLLNTKYVMGFSPNAFIIEAGCCIATFREQCHNAGLRFARVKPINGDNHSCWLEVDIDPEL